MQVFEHTVQAIHTETIHLRKVWESGLDVASGSNQVQLLAQWLLSISVLDFWFSS